jgi:hypothetical protein
MKDVKTPTSRSYHDYLISSLKNPERAAGNIEVALKLEEKDPQPAPASFDTSGCHGGS